MCGLGQVGFVMGGARDTEAGGDAAAGEEVGCAGSGVERPPGNWMSRWEGAARTQAGHEDVGEGALRSLLKQEDGLAREEGGEGGGPGRSRLGKGERGDVRPPLCEWHPQRPSLLLGPQCPLPFNTSDVAGGAILCERATGPGGSAIQRCQLRCLRGYWSAFPPGPLLCGLEEGRWVSQPPQPHACQRECLPRTLLSPLGLRAEHLHSPRPRVAFPR